MYTVFFSLCRKVWKMTFWKVPSAGGLILQLPTAQAGPHKCIEFQDKTLRQSGKNALYIAVTMERGFINDEAVSSASPFRNLI